MFCFNSMKQSWWEFNKKSRGQRPWSQSSNFIYLNWWYFVWTLPNKVVRSNKKSCEIHMVKGQGHIGQMSYIFCDDITKRSWSKSTKSRGHQVKCPCSRGQISYPNFIYFPITWWKKAGWNYNVNTEEVTWPMSRSPGQRSMAQR